MSKRATEHMMPQEISKRINALVTLYGSTILDDPDRFEAIMTKHCPKAKREIYVLTCAIRTGLVREIQTSDSNRSLIAKQLVRKLQDEFGITQSLSKWAVKCMVESLGFTVRKSTRKDRSGNRTPPSPEETLRQVIKEAFQDEHISDDERKLIASLCRKLSISIDTAAQILAEVTSARKGKETADVSLASASKILFEPVIEPATEFEPLESTTLDDMSLEVNIGRIASRFDTKLDFKLRVHSSGDAHIILYANDPTDMRKSGIMLLLDDSGYTDFKNTCAKLESTINKLRNSNRVNSRLAIRFD